MTVSLSELFLDCVVESGNALHRPFCFSPKCSKRVVSRGYVPYGRFEVKCTYLVGS